ncbi:MAG: rRNA pseudouridine synthase, partial [Bacteroidales bacterium]|nr:rRNA pseudouridine synthase [Candidatus Cryptobacteroides aphodequi]
SEHKPYGEHSSHSEGRPYGERKSYGENKPYGERRSYGASKPYGERKQYGEGKPYGERKSNGENKPYGERRSYGASKPYGERKQYGEGKPYGERKSYGENKPYGERRSFGGNKPYGQRRGPAAKNQTWSKASDEGMDRMLSRKPQVNGAEYSDADTVKTPIREEVRLNKFIANSGVCSRREADTLIEAGVVTVNGEVVTELGTKVNIYKDDIRFNGEKLKGEEKVYIIMNKPKGYVTTASDPHADKTVMELLKGCQYRVFPVGRLDKNTTGVLMFTNDGEIAARLPPPSYDQKKIYQVLLDKPLSDEDHIKILTGITLNDGPVNADELEFIEAEDHRKLGIEIHSGKNRIVRRIFESLGYEVKALDRVYFAGLTKKGLKKGEWRQLTEGEVNILKMGAYV